MRIISSIVGTAISLFAIVAGLIILLYGISMFSAAGADTLERLGLDPNRMPEYTTQEDVDTFISKFPTWAQAPLKSFADWVSGLLKYTPVDLSDLNPDIIGGAPFFPTQAPGATDLPQPTSAPTLEPTASEQPAADPGASPTPTPEPVNTEAPTQSPTEAPTATEAPLEEPSPTPSS